MEIELVLVAIDKKEKLSQLLKDYQREIVGENVEEYKYLDSYWGSEDRKAFFIMFKKKIAGFVLINKHTVVEKNATSVAEFYVKKEFRLGGVGRKVIKMLFEKFRGKWEIAEMKDNILAQNFWRKVIGEYTNNNYREVILDNDKWRGPVQIFEN